MIRYWVNQIWVVDSEGQKEIDTTTTIHFKLNGRSVALKGDEKRTLLWVLRTDLALTWVK